MQQNEILLALRQDIAELRKILRPQFLNNQITEKWVAEKQLRSFFSYESTQMAAFLKCPDLIVSKVGKRKFILRESIEKLLEKNIQDHSLNP